MFVWHFRGSEKKNDTRSVYHSRWTNVSAASTRITVIDVFYSNTSNFVNIVDILTRIFHFNVQINTARFLYRTARRAKHWLQVFFFFNIFWLIALLLKYNSNRGLSYRIPTLLLLFVIRSLLMPLNEFYFKKFNKNNSHGKK